MGLRMGSIRGTAAVVRELHARENHNGDSDQVHYVPATLAIKGVPSPKTMVYRWHRLVSLHDVARTSGSWGADKDASGWHFRTFSDDEDEKGGMLEVVPKGRILKVPGRLQRSMTRSHGASYGTRGYLTDSNLMPLPNKAD